MRQRQKVGDIRTRKQEPGFPDESALEPRTHATGCRTAPLDKNPSRDRDTLIVKGLIRPGSVNAFVHLRELFESRDGLVRHVYFDLRISLGRRKVPHWQERLDATLTSRAA